MEFETLFYNPVIDRLEMMCKNCEDDKKKTITIFTFNTSTNQFADSPTVINVSSIFKEMNEKPFHIKASGAAIHPFTGDIYVLSSVNKLLVILDKYHQVKSSYPLNPKLFKQPEGITFSENGTLIISNESAKAGPANLLLFRYKK